MPKYELGDIPMEKSKLIIILLMSCMLFIIVGCVNFDKNVQVSQDDEATNENVENQTHELNDRNELHPNKSSNGETTENEAPQKDGLKEKEEKPLESKDKEKEKTNNDNTNNDNTSNSETPDTEESLEPKQRTSELDKIKFLLPSQNSEPRTEAITHVVIHFVSNAFNNPKDPYNIKDIYAIFEQYKVSANYVINRDGQIYLFVPENRVAYHAGSGNLTNFPEYENRLNHYSIGIELLAIGTREEMIPVITAEKFDLIDPSLIGYTDAQYQALSALLDDILIRNTSIKRDRKHIIGHDEYAPSRKTDPGSLFDWSRIGF